MGKGPNGPVQVGEFRELVLIETETPPLADAALVGNLHLLFPPRVQLEEDSPFQYYNWFPQGLFTFQLIPSSPKKTLHRKDTEVQKYGTADPRPHIWEDERGAKLLRNNW